MYYTDIDTYYELDEIFDVGDIDFSQLTPREKSIIIRMYYADESTISIAHYYDLSPRRIQQIAKEALTKMRTPRNLEAYDAMCDFRNRKSEKIM